MANPIGGAPPDPATGAPQSQASAPGQHPSASAGGDIPPGLRMWQKMFPNASKEQLQQMNNALLKTVGDSIQKDQAKAHEHFKERMEQWKEDTGG